ncbi:hypothetical protein Tco_0355287 [Tanacetum coccineum]
MSSTQMDSRLSKSSDVSSGFAAEREKAIGCLEKEKPTFCLNSKDGLSPMRAGTPDGGVQAQFAERAEYFSEMAVEGNRFRPTVGLGLELEMLEGTLKTIEDTMARMDKEVYAIYRHMSNIGSGAATGKLQSRLQGEEDLQGFLGSSGNDKRPDRTERSERNSP